MKENIKIYIGEIILVLSALAFSFEWFFIRGLSKQGFSVFDITFVRATGALFILSIILPIFFKKVFDFKKINKSDIKYFIILGLIAVVSNVIYNLAFIHTTVANVQIILYLSVFWGIIFGFLFLKEKLVIKKIIYTLFAFIGICLALLYGNTELAFAIGVGELLALGTSFLWTTDAVIARKIKHTNPFFRMFFIYIIVSVVTFFIILFMNDFSYFQKFLSYDFLLFGFGLAITAGVLGKGLMYLGINYVPVSIALVIMLLEPISQMTTAYFFANEKLAIINMFGIFIVFLMVILISKKIGVKDNLMTIDKRKENTDTF